MLRRSVALVALVAVVMLTSHANAGMWHGTKAKGGVTPAHFMFDKLNKFVKEVETLSEQFPDADNAAEFLRDYEQAYDATMQTLAASRPPVEWAVGKIFAESPDEDPGERMAGVLNRRDLASEWFRINKARLKELFRGWGTDRSSDIKYDTTSFVSASSSTLGLASTKHVPTTGTNNNGDPITKVNGNGVYGNRPLTTHPTTVTNNEGDPITKVNGNRVSYGNRPLTTHPIAIVLGGLSNGEAKVQAVTSVLPTALAAEPFVTASDAATLGTATTDMTPGTITDAKEKVGELREKNRKKASYPNKEDIYDTYVYGPEETNLFWEFRAYVDPTGTKVIQDELRRKEEERRLQDEEQRRQDEEKRLQDEERRQKQLAEERRQMEIENARKNRRQAKLAIWRKANCHGTVQDGVSRILKQTHLRDVDLAVKKINCYYAMCLWSDLVREAVLYGVCCSGQGRDFIEKLHQKMYPYNPNKPIFISAFRVCPHFYGYDTLTSSRLPECQKGRVPHLEQSAQLGTKSLNYASLEAVFNHHGHYDSRCADAWEH